MSQEAMKLALEKAFELGKTFCEPTNSDYFHQNVNGELARLIERTQEALAHHCEDNLDMVEQEQGEPVAWMHKRSGRLIGHKPYGSIDEWDSLYTTPQPAPQSEPAAWMETDMAYRPNGLPQEFIHHEVESPDDWSEWVCPKPEQYFMKCCDCGLVHEAQFRVAKYGEGDYCELVEDKDTQAQFRMRRRTTPQQRTWVGLTDDEMADIAAQGHQRWKEYAEAIEAKLKEKNCL